GGAGGRELAEHVPGMRDIERVTNTGDVPGGEVDRDPGYQLEGAHAIAARITQAREQRHGGARIGNGGEGRCEGAQLREELQARGGDDAEGAFRAEEERLDVVTGVVLAQGPERGE